MLATMLLSNEMMTERFYYLILYISMWLKETSSFYPDIPAKAQTESTRNGAFQPLWWL